MLTDLQALKQLCREAIVTEDRDANDFVEYVNNMDAEALGELCVKLGVDPKDQDDMTFQLEDKIMQTIVGPTEHVRIEILRLVQALSYDMEVINNDDVQKLAFETIIGVMTNYVEYEKEINIDRLKWQCDNCKGKVLCDIVVPSNPCPVKVDAFLEDVDPWKELGEELERRGE